MNFSLCFHLYQMVSWKHQRNQALKILSVNHFYKLLCCLTLAKIRAIIAQIVTIFLLPMLQL